MQPFGKAQSVKRVEDLRFLTGHGRYTDDIAPEGALFAHVIRSDVAHGRLVSVDATEARAAPGVALVLTGKDLAEAGITQGLHTVMVPNGDGTRNTPPKRPLLAEDRVRFVGEPVALVVADTREAALDAAELIEVEIDDLPVHMALDAGGEALHSEAPDNRAFDFGFGDRQAVEAAFAAAAHRVALEVVDNRIHSAPLETRAAWADWDGERLHLCLGGQGVWVHKEHVARILGLDPEQVRVTTEDVGGGFGTKAMVYPEYFLVSEAARRLGRPVRWMATRGEGMLSDNAGRDLVSTAELAFDADFRITGYRVHTRANMGAYLSQFGPLIQSQLFSRVMPGVYDIPAMHLRSEGIFTNTVQTDAFRGAGRPEAIYVLERVMDRAARELGVDPWDLHRRNFISPAAFPYRSAAGELYDVGDFARVLDHAEIAADREGLATRRAEAEARGHLYGQGLCYYIEAILGAASEDVRLVLTPEGAEIHVGTQSNGQGHETVFARYLADHTGLPMEAITVRQGDSDLIPRGGGTGGSRSVTVQTNVTLQAVRRLTSGLAEFLAAEIGTPPDDVQFDDDRFRIAGSNLTPSLLEAAEMAREAGREDLLDIRDTAELPGRSFPNGAHLAEVDIDPETGHVEVTRYRVVDDFGTLINPMLAEGQVHGGVAHGIGQALREHVVYDESGQLLAASFMDYAVPRAADLPFIRFETEPVPSTANVLGMKGCGEAGTVGALAAVSNAVQDALWGAGVRQADMPFTPSRVWEMLEGAKSGG
ncbi:xanthine dehydrogenase family protein molybdopterin-binding subunit [Litorisediminicola beolgyonensis]|uniref:Xanthine dehydrogenase family protein molybdopterin-binding subunit n=1 Tax=Litorisediminicola beolgyonensis TaxID=1173614 RepID=A0ABW3ZDT1_9RHOB